MMGRGGDRGGFPPRGGPRGGMGWGGPQPGNVQKRAGDWDCPNPLVTVYIYYLFGCSFFFCFDGSNYCLTAVDVETRTSPGGWSVTSVKLQNLKGLSLHLFLMEVQREISLNFWLL